MPKSSKKEKKVDPFKTRKTKTTDAKVADTLTPPPEVAEAIDAFRECQDQAKHFEGEATVHKDLILKYARDEYVKRLDQGVGKSFKLLGDETMVTYVMMDSSAGITEEELSEFASQWGEEAAEKLVTRDLANIRFDPKVLEANYDAVVEALQSLPPEILDKLFKPMLLKAAPGALEKAKQFAKDDEQMKEIIAQLKIKNYIK